MNYVIKSSFMYSTQFAEIPFSLCDMSTGIPSLTGTTELTVHVINVNDKKPYFTPSVQRAEVSADAPPGTMLHTLVAVDPDIVDNTQLMFELAKERMVRAVDKNGKEVSLNYTSI